jgi:hypothetical protein
MLKTLCDGGTCGGLIKPCLAEVEISDIQAWEG